MRSSLDVAMVVFKMFKCLLSLLVVVFFVRGNHCKPGYDEHPNDSGIGSTLWGWVSYLNPWGSDCHQVTSKSSPISELDISSTQSNNGSIAEARLLTAATVHVNPTTALKPVSKQSLELQATTPIMSASTTMSTKNPRKEHFMESNASIAAITSAPINIITSEISAIEPNAEFEPNAPTISILTDEDFLETTQVPESEHYLELIVSTTPIALNQDIPTTTEEFVSTTLIVPVKENPTTTEEPLTEHYLDLEKSISLLKPMSDQDIFTTTNEPVLKEPLDLEESTILSHSSIPTTTEESKTEQPLEPETIEPVIEPETIEPVIEYQPPMKPRTSSISKYMDQNNNEGPLEVEVPIISEISDLIDPIQVSYPEVGVAVKYINKVFTEDNQVLILTDFAADSNPGKEIYMTRREEVPTEENEISILSVSTDQYSEVEPEQSGRDATNYTKVNKESVLLTEPVTDLYSVVGRDEVSTEESETTILTESTTIFYPGVEVAVTQRSEGLAVKKEELNQHEPATEEDTSVSITSIEHSTNPLLEGNIALYKLIYGMPTEVRVDAMFTAVDGVSSEVDAVSSKVDSVFTAVDAVSKGFDRTVLTKLDRSFATPRVRLPKSSTTHNAGFLFSFDYRLTLLCHTIFLVMF